MAPITDRFHFVGFALSSQHFCERLVESIRPQQCCADASLAAFEHWQPQTAALRDCGKKQSGGRSYEPVRQREGRSVWQPVLAEHKVELCTGNQTASIPIRRREMASAAALVEPKQQFDGTPWNLTSEKNHYRSVAHAISPLGQASDEHRHRNSDGNPLGKLDITPC
jgi:hypothetical protein